MFLHLFDEKHRSAHYIRCNDTAGLYFHSSLLYFDHKKEKTHPTKPLQKFLTFVTILQDRFSFPSRIYYTMFWEKVKFPELFLSTSIFFSPLLDFLWLKYYSWSIKNHRTKSRSFCNTFLSS